MVTIGPSPLKLLGAGAVVPRGDGRGRRRPARPVADVPRPGLAAVGRLGHRRRDGAVAFGGPAALLLMSLLGRRPRVEIDAEGFVLRTAFGPRRRRWADVDGDFV